MSLQSKIEALLFVVGQEGISIDELAYYTHQPTNVIYEEIEQLSQKYLADAQCALNILEVGTHYVLTTKKEMADLLKTYAQSSLSHNLSQAALESLSIIAYKQPITRVEIDDIRGVQSSGSLQKLLARNLIEERGRMDGPGRPILYGTTNYFMNYFGLESLDQLPSIDEMEKEFADDMPTDLFFDKLKEELNDQDAFDSHDLTDYLNEQQDEISE
ncbi:SMC-Scp complex subunit ScpB [Vagococcus xieshaowenii]|uniref:Segregation and condensation protein B n=1 Tax=Vagococcus xieshaowenii TaxID=2562451 RepID=A0AAJ5EE66_9ENTE|nr:SMC-Scp complex subunit ScpB [Vagococcus xieshaowenii]QCA29598.1 SMC-Scp complex subunit ScpB [Vagococcus xieshaowenii]TFZ40663.1 SMC-Scp complex subunit ScpB [Vagococcus xieshaowenii]